MGRVFQTFPALFKPNQMIRLIPLLLIAACHHEIVTPSCSFIEASRVGERISIKIYSDEPHIAMCRELPDRTECRIIKSNFYGCISISGSVGDVIHFRSESDDCQIVIQ